MELPVTPKTLDEWYKWAARLDNNYHKMMRIIGGGFERKKPDNNRKKWMFTRKDLNAMDVDAMSIEERRKKGHVSDARNQDILARIARQRTRLLESHKESKRR